MKIVKNFFSYLQGKWVTQKTIYSIIKNYKTDYKELLNIKNFSTNKNKLKFICQNLNNNLYIIKLFNQKVSKININSQNTYDFFVINKKLVKVSIKYILPKKNIFYYEYLYFINTNFMISIGILTNKSKYISIIYTSYIKKN